MSRGGYRPGAGRPKGSKNRSKGPVKTPRMRQVTPGMPGHGNGNLSPLDYMLAVMRNSEVDDARRDRMAVAAAPFVHARKDAGTGKKEEQERQAGVAAQGKFAAAPAPILKFSRGMSSRRIETNKENDQ